MLAIINAPQYCYEIFCTFDSNHENINSKLTYFRVVTVADMVVIWHFRALKLFGVRFRRQTETIISRNFCECSTHV